MSTYQEVLGEDPSKGEEIKEIKPEFPSKKAKQKQMVNILDNPSPLNKRIYCGEHIMGA